MSEPTSASRYWVLRGSFGPGQTVAWASQPVLHQGGLIEGRLVGDPGPFTLGVPSAIGAPPERVTTTVEIDNADGAIDRWVVGAERTTLEYSQPSFLTFEGQIYRGTVAADGTCTEEAFTPPLAVSGPVTVDRAKCTISLTLAHVDRPMLGPIRRLYSVREVTSPPIAGSIVFSTFLDEAAGGVGADPLWQHFASSESDSLDRTVPFLYGPVTAPLIRVTPDGVYPAAYVAGMAWDRAILPLHPWPRIAAKIRSESSDRPEAPDEPLPFLVRVELPFEDTTRFAWLALALQLRAPKESAKAEKYWWVSNYPNGLTRDDYSDEVNVASPAQVLRTIISDHSEAGAACLHEPSWDAAVARQRTSMSQACAGRIEAETTIADLVEFIAPIGGMSLWVGPDGLLRVALTGWTREDKDEAAGALPELLENEVYPGDTDGTPVWSEAIPSDPDDHGAVLTKVTPRWTDEQRELFPLAVAMGTSPRRVPLKVDAEWEPEAAWINAREPGPVVRAMTSRGVYPTRRVHTVSHASIARLGPGALLRISHPWGVTAEPPYRRRLVRLERAEVQPSEHAALLTLEDLGPAEQIRIGLLDTLDEWIRFDPTEVGYEIQMRPEGSQILSPDGVFEEDMVGCTIWVTGAEDDENNRSYEIVNVVGANEVEVEPSPASGENIVATSADPIDAAWLIVRTDRSTLGRHREDYIRGARLPDGVLDDGRTGFQFGS